MTRDEAIHAEHAPCQATGCEEALGQAMVEAGGFLCLKCRGLFLGMPAFYLVLRSTPRIVLCRCRNCHPGKKEETRQ